MLVTQTDLDGVLVLETKIFGDQRGFFTEAFNQGVFDAAIGRHVTFVQDNHSRSGRGVLRGLHYQLPPRAQGKVVRVVTGRIFDVAVDVRRSSATFGHWTGVELSEEDPRQLWIPPGFAHGFLVLSDRADVLYKTTDYYDAPCEVSLRWDDPDVAIRWPAIDVPFVVSAKDRAARPLRELPSFD